MADAIDGAGHAQNAPVDQQMGELPAAPVRPAVRLIAGLCAFTALLAVAMLAIRAAQSPATVLAEADPAGTLWWSVILATDGAGFLLTYFSLIGWRRTSTRALLRSLPAVWILVLGIPMFAWGYGVFAYFRTRSPVDFIGAAISGAVTLLGAVLLAAWTIWVALGAWRRHAYRTAPAEPLRGPAGALGIASAVLPFLGLGPAGLILGLIARAQSKSAGKKNTPAMVGIISGVISVAILLVILLVYLGVFISIAVQCQQLGPGTHQSGSVTIYCS